MGRHGPPDIPGRYRWIILESGAAVIYDREDPNAWVQSTLARDHDEAR